MKNFVKRAALLGIILLTINQSLRAQPVFSESPGISWKSITWPPFEPDGITPLPQDESSEDWWYDHKNVYVGDEHVGYIAVGFMRWVNEIHDGPTTYVNVGCWEDDGSSGCQYLEADGDVMGTSYASAAMYDLQGNMLWHSVFATGEFSRVIQNSEGEFVAIGKTWDVIDIEGNQIEYNPGEDANTNYFYCDEGDPHGVTGQKAKMYVVHFDMEGSKIVNYMYGKLDYASSPLAAHSAIVEGRDLIQTPEGDYLLVGAHNGSGSRGLVIKTDNNFQVDGIMNFGPSNQTVYFNAIEMALDESVYAISGTEDQGGGTHYPLLLTIDGTTYSQKAYETYPAPDSVPSACWDVSFTPEGDVLLPVLYKLTDPYQFDSWIYLLDASDGSLVTTAGWSNNPTYITITNVYDNKVGITEPRFNTDGFAVVTSVHASQEHDSIDPYLLERDPECWYFDRLWGDIFYYEDGNAYVAKYTLTGNKLWEKEFDIDDVYDSERDYFPGDIKHMECMYSISQTEDGGYVIAGNNSINYDDYYMAKITGDCAMYVEDDELEENERTVTGNVTFSPGTMGTSTLKIKGEIVVKSTGTLTINEMTLEFFDSRSCGVKTNITVEPGGALYVLSSRLTSLTECEFTTWDGISILGDPEEDHTTAYQGYVYLADAVIENAIYGIAASHIQYNDGLYPEPDGTEGGGMVEAFQTQFKNCRFSTHFTSYPYSKSNSITNNSTFTDCEFISEGVGHPGAEGLGASAHLVGWNVSGIEVHGCDFTNDLSSLDLPLKGVGIGGIDCSIIVDDYESTPTTFNNMDYGVDISATYDAGSIVDIFGCEFNNNNHGILMEGVHYPIIADNTFVVGQGELDNPNLMNEFPYGIYLYDCNEYVIEDNNLETPQSDHSIGIASFGDVANSYSNRIYRNVMKNFLFASYGGGDNRGLWGVTGYAAEQGLHFKCNRYFDAQYDIYTDDEWDGISAQQGTNDDETTPAGNEFDGCMLSEGELFNDGESYTYVAHNTSGYIPDVGGGCVSSGSVTVTIALDGFDPETSCPEGIKNDPRSRMKSPALIYREKMKDVEGEMATVITGSEKYKSLQVKRDEALGSLMKEMHRNTSASRRTEMISLLESETSRERKAELLDLYITDKQYDKAQALMSELSANFPETSDYMLLKEKVMQWKKNGKTAMELKNDPDALALAEQLAAEPKQYGSMQARVMLKLVFGRSIPEVYPKLPANVATTPEKAPEELPVTETQLTIYPNPYFDRTTLEILLTNDQHEGYLKVYNMNGQKLLSVRLQPGKNNVVLSGEQLPAGLYWVALEVNGEVKKQSKLVRMK